MPKLKESKLFETFVTKTVTEIRNECYNHIHCGKDVNARDSETGETYLHSLCDVTEHLMDENGVSIIYILGCNGLDLDIQDFNGETFLHKVVLIPGAYRALVAAIRCGADMMIKDNKERTAKDILLTEKPNGWQEMLHWWNKFTPGLYRATLADKPNKHLTETLLKYWCSVNMVKQGKCYNTSTKLQQGAHAELVNLLEKYQKNNELILAALTGQVQIFQNVIKKIGTDGLSLDLYDWSYQCDIESPEIPLPLLQYIWMTNNVGMSQLILDNGADPAVLFTWGTEPPKPLFFQLVCGKYKPEEEIIYKTLEKSNMLAKDYEGQTLLYEAIRQKAPAPFVQFLLKRGINIAARDKCGQTARDYATSPRRRRKKYQRMIDKHVATKITDNDIKYVENLMIQGYDHIMDVVDVEDGGVISLVQSKPMAELLERYEKSQAHIKKMLRIAKNGRLAELRPLMGRKYMTAVDIGGRNVCHIAIVNKRREFIRCFCDHYPTLLNRQDNLGRTPYHYAEVLLEDDDLTLYMTQCGADSEIKDVQGLTPTDYKCSHCGEKTFYTLQTEMNNYAMDVYVAYTNFQENMETAIQDGDMVTVNTLIKGLKYHTKDNQYLNRYNSLLFNCIETKQQDIAMHLIHEGMDVKVFKQYKKCNPTHQKCKMSKCKHRVYSLREVAEHMKANKVLSLMDGMERVQAMEENQRESKNSIPMAFSQFGLV